MTRIFDLVAASVALMVLLPVFGVIAVAIRLDSPGPVFYYGLRVGRNETLFRIRKFRTMVVGADAVSPTTGALDPRVTRIGGVLRRWKLDELPQLINIVRGEMAFVGPRPEVIENTNDYSEPQREIFTVRPGITDLASIYLFRMTELVGNDDPHGTFVSRYRDEKNRLRLEYVRTRSLWLDFSILVATATAVFTGGRCVWKLSPQIRNVARV